MIKMAEQKEVPKKKAKAEGKMTVKSYQQDINVEKQKMGAYSKKFGSTVKSLKADFKKHEKDLKEAASNMRKEGIKHMGNKINQFKGEIKTATKKMNDGVDKLKGDIEDQIKENKTAVAHIASNIKYFLGEINKKKRDFRSYAKVSFWGVSE
jgi:hypothetical protein